MRVFFILVPRAGAAQRPKGTQTYSRDSFLWLMEDYMQHVLNFTPRLSSSNSGATDFVSLTTVYSLGSSLNLVTH